MPTLTNCEHCGKEFNANKYDSEKGMGRFCSLKCMGLSRRGGDWKPNWRGGKEERVCPTCGDTFEVWPSQKKTYCSHKCIDRTGRKYGRRKPSPPVGLTCKECGETFEVPYKERKKRKFCSVACSAKHTGKQQRGEGNPAWVAKIKCICKLCNKEFEVTPYYAQGRQFCSGGCVRQWQLENWSGENSPAWVEPIELECAECGMGFMVKPSKKRKLCSIECRHKWYSRMYGGENSHSWLDGRSFEPYGTEFDDELRALIRDRDSYACRWCGEEEGETAHSVHHIDYDKTNNKQDNLITLCRVHHGETGHNRAEWEEVLSAMMHE